MNAHLDKAKFYLAQVAVPDNLGGWILGVGAATWSAMFPEPALGTLAMILLVVNVIDLAAVWLACVKTEMAWEPRKATLTLIKVGVYCLAVILASLLGVALHEVAGVVGVGQDKKYATIGLVGVTLGAGIFREMTSAFKHLRRAGYKVPKVVTAAIKEGEGLVGEK